MVFKLVHIDSENPLKIKLEPGIHVFGRGKFLNINDKRISRKHGQFEVTDDSLIITALHQNPCFYQKKDTTQTQTLKQSSTVSLQNGDKLGLLPTSYWYEVLQCTPTSNKENSQTEKESQEYATDEVPIDSGEDTDNEMVSRIHSVANVVSKNDNPESQSTEVLSPNNFDTESHLKDKDLDNEPPVIQNAPAIDTISGDSKLSTAFDSDKNHVDEPVSPLLLSSYQETEDKSNEAESSSSEQSHVMPKRPHSVSEDSPHEEIKKIKTESESNPDVKLDPDDQKAGSSSNINAGAGHPQAAPAPLRERCMYGSSCYRRNPVHRAQFSHPNDVDWGTGEKAPCPWGAACGKRDPRHWRDHEHPPGKDQPPPPPGVRVVHRQGNVFYINANTVNFYDDHFAAEDSDGNSVDYDYEF